MMAHAALVLCAYIVVTTIMCAYFQLCVRSYVQQLSLGAHVHTVPCSYLWWKHHAHREQHEAVFHHPHVATKPSVLGIIVILLSMGKPSVLGTIVILLNELRLHLPNTS